MLHKELSDKEGIIADLERQLMEATRAMDAVRRENRELSGQVIGWADQYQYIQESTSVVIESSARKNLEFKSKESKLVGKTQRLDEENRNLKSEMGKLAGEVQELNQTVYMLRSEHLIIARLNDDLENRLTLVKNGGREQAGSQIRSVTDSQLDKSLNFELEFNSLASFNNLRLENETCRRPTLPSRLSPSKSQVQSKPPSRKNHRPGHPHKDTSIAKVANEEEIESKYCHLTKCSMF